MDQATNGVRVFWQSILMIALAPMLSSLFALPSAYSHTAYLGVGGGFSPESSPVTLESNLIAFSNLVRFVGGARPTLLYGAGPDGNTDDVVEQSPNISAEDMLFFALFAPSGHTKCYRRNNLDYVSEASTATNVIDYLTLHGANPEVKRLRFYYTGHGAMSEDYALTRDFHGNTINLWDRKLSAREFTETLDHFADRPLHTQIVMTQCYSGGFSSINWQGGSPNQQGFGPEGELSAANRCGFFSQLPDREASGCSNNPHDREEYSPWFFAAFRQNDQQGNLVYADYDANNLISADEAHAYAIIHANSIDVPVTTSSSLLRDIEAVFADMSLIIHLRRQDWPTFASTMNAAEREIIVQITKELGYDISKPPMPYHFAAERMRECKSTLDLVRDTTYAAEQVLKDIRKRISERLDKELPAWRSNGKAGIEAAKAVVVPDAEYSLLQAAYEEFVSARREQQKWTRRLVKWERVNYLLETKLLESLLHRSAKTPEIEAFAQKYLQLKTCEAQPFF